MWYCQGWSGYGGQGKAREVISRRGSRSRRTLSPFFLGLNDLKIDRSLWLVLGDRLRRYERRDIGEMLKVS